MLPADPLALPRVPHPAPANHPWRDRIVAAAFVLALPVLALVKPFGGDSTLLENRSPAKWPSLFPLAGFAPRFERAFADRFHSRDALILLHHAALVKVFHTSPVSNVLIGRDGWLFWLGEDGRSLDRLYRGTLPIEDSGIAATAAELARREHYLASRGIAYLVVVVPEKFTIYPEHLPEFVIQSPAPHPLVRLGAMIVAAGVSYIDLTDALRNAKASARVYYQTDSHWNLFGAAVGYEMIMREVQQLLGDKRLPAIAAPLRPPYVPGADWYRGDLARMIVGAPFYREPDYAPLSKVLADPSGRCARRIDDGKDDGFQLYHCARPGLPKAIVYHDSMAIYLMPLVSENFSRVLFVSGQRLDAALIEREKPDIVIEELVERGLLVPGYSAM
jgi:alginate O-acetyltransferase complex protein AlgJ